MYKNNDFCDWASLYESYKNLCTKEHKVLEIGASTIKRTKQLSKHCKKLIGIELIPKRKPRNFKNVEYLTGDWQELSKIIKPKSIDLAISSHVIEHVPNDLKAINELYKVLKPDGIALINTPNRKRLIRAIIEFFTNERKFPYWEHIREYTEEDLIKLLKQSKFQNWNIIPVVFGFHNKFLNIYLKKVPKLLRKFANYWEIHLFK